MGMRHIAPLRRLTAVLFALCIAFSALAAAADQRDYAAQQVLPLTPSDEESGQAGEHMAKMAAGQSLNVLKQPLALHSLNPRTGFLRDGYCRVPPGDVGHHSVAGVVTDEFLAFSAARGNDLRAVPGMRAGCRWCLCAARWLEAFRERDRLGLSVVPRVRLEATHERALEVVRLEDLRLFAVEGGEGGEGVGRGSGSGSGT